MDKADEFKLFRATIAAAKAAADKAVDYSSRVKQTVEAAGIRVGTRLSVVAMVTQNSPFPCPFVNLSNPAQHCLHWTMVFAVCQSGAACVHDHCA